MVCRGCKRFAAEVVSWNRFDDAAKHAVWQRLLMLRDQVVAGRLEVIDRTLLEAQLKQHRIPFLTEDSDASRAYLLLRRGARHMVALEPYGLSALAPYDTLTPLALRDLVDADYQQLSEAHFERYFGLQDLAGPA